MKEIERWKEKEKECGDRKEAYFGFGLVATRRLVTLTERTLEATTRSDVP